jgi:hypothetical protein
MTSSNKAENHSVSNNNLIDTSLQELIGEAKALFQALDSTSAKIRDFEKSLSELKAHFPFRSFLKEDKLSSLNELTERHLSKTKALHLCDDQLRYRTRTCWYLSWESEENSKNFRLLLMSTQKEIIVWASGGEVVEGIDPYESEVVFKRPLIEMDLPTRLQFAEYLSAFIVNFTKYLRKCRESIDCPKVDLSGDRKLTPLEHFLTYNPITGKNDYQYGKTQNL